MRCKPRAHAPPVRVAPTLPVPLDDRSRGIGVCGILPTVDPQQPNPPEVPPPQATAAGCLLALVAVVVTVWLCFAIGPRFFGWAVSLFPEGFLEFQVMQLLLERSFTDR